MSATLMSPWRCYFVTVTRVLGQPKRFFKELPEVMSVKSSILFILVSAFLSALFSAIGFPSPNPITRFGIYLINAVGMCVITTVIGYISLGLIWGRKIRLGRLFAIVSISSGVTLLASWIPHFTLFTEPWKWWLISIGIVYSCNLKWWKTAISVIVTMLIMTLVFFSFLPVIAASYP